MNTYLKVFLIIISFALSWLFGFIFWSLVPPLLKFYGLQQFLQRRKWPPKTILRLERSLCRHLCHALYS